MSRLRLVRRVGDRLSLCIERWGSGRAVWRGTCRFRRRSRGLWRGVLVTADYLMVSKPAICSPLAPRLKRQGARDAMVVLVIDHVSLNL